MERAMEGESVDVIVSEKMNKKMEEANRFSDSQLSSVHHHIQFTLQKAYFKCAYECYDRTIHKDEVDECVDYCAAPFLKAHYLVEAEIEQFQDGLKNSMKACQEKFEEAKSLRNREETPAMNELELCLDQSVKASIKTLPHVAERLERFLSIH